MEYTVEDNFVMKKNVNEGIYDRAINQAGKLKIGQSFRSELPYGKLPNFRTKCNASRFLQSEENPKGTLFKFHYCNNEGNIRITRGEFK